MNENPVEKLDRTFIDDLGEDWDLSGRPEEVILGVPEGTVETLLRQINEEKRWPLLYEAAKRHSEQWMLDLSDFFPHEEAFVEPLVNFLLMAKNEHAKVCFAQEAEEWEWGQETKHLLPVVIERVRQIREEIENGGEFSQLSVPTLDRTIEHLTEVASQLSSTN